MKFFVDFRSGKSPKPRTYPRVELTQNNWDDYGYKTTFDATLHLAEDDEIELGTLKIMKESQEGGYTDLPKRAFETLGAKFCSLGGDLDYYEKGCCHINSPSLHDGMPFVDQATFAAIFHAANASNR